MARDLSRLTLQVRKPELSLQELEALLPQAEAYIARTRQFGVADITSVAIVRKAELLMRLERYREATVELSEARKLLGDLRQPDLGAVILAKLAECYGKSADWLAAAGISEEGIRLVERYRYNVTAPYMQSGYLQSRVSLYTWGIWAAYEQQDHSRMLALMELSKGRATLRYRVGESEAESEGVDLAQLQDEFKSISQQIDAAGERADSQGLAPLLARRRTLWDLITMHRYRQVTGERLPEFELKAVQQLLAPDEAVVYYYWLERQTLLVALIDGEQVVPHFVSLTPRQRSRLEDYAHHIQKILVPVGWLDDLSRWGSFLIPQADLLKEKKRLIISPHKLLHALPFHALQWQGDCLLRTFAVSYLPNLSTLLIPQPGLQGQQAIVVGIKDFQVENQNVQPLPTAEVEAHAVAQLYRERQRPVQTILTQQAQEKNLEALLLEHSLQGIRCLHLATHGENIPSDTPLESYLYMQSSVLDGLEIASWRLNLDLVVLSACSSGQRSIKGRGMSELPGDELFGLQAAFANAGCRRLISALWPVDGNAAPSIMTAFHRYWLEGCSAEVALQAAMLDFLDKSNPASRQVYFWAPFFLSRYRR